VEQNKTTAKQRDSFSIFFLQFYPKYINSEGGYANYIIFFCLAVSSDLGSNIYADMGIVYNTYSHRKCKKVVKK
jgi:hypothetical protein